MAELVAGPFVTFVVERLGNLLIQEGQFLGGVRGQVQQLQTELNMLQGFLQAADARREVGDELVIRNCVAEIREATYDAEDVIATFVVKVAFRGRDQFPYVLKRYLCIFKEYRTLHKVGLEIEAINLRITNSLTRGLQTCGILHATGVRENSSTPRFETQRQLRRTYTHTGEEDVVGIEEDLETVVGALVNQKTRYKVVFICGMGGLGKTTLAKRVYNHSEIKRYFDCFAWAYISQQCNTREVLEGILIKLLSPSKEGRKEIEKLKHDELVKNLYQVQSQKKCLVILDDIWQDTDWDNLNPAFLNTTEVGSKILLTTRNKEIAKHVDQQYFLYELRFLTQEESWELFEKKTSRRREGAVFPSSKKMIKLGKEMVRHCGGLPLAIVVLGGLLATKHNLNEWEMVRNDVSYYLGKSEGHAGLPPFDILSLSYQDLPYQLKACFLYLSHFPENYDIHAETLVQMWMADDILLPSVPSQVEEMKVEETMLDVGMNYLGELAQRCMVQIQFSEFTNTIELCRLHNLMRDLCLSKAQEERFVKVGRLDPFNRWGITWEKSASSYSSSLFGIRKLAVHYFGDNSALNELKITDVHYCLSCQFYVFGRKLGSFDWKQIKSFLKGLKSLRILHLESSPIRDAKNMMLPNLFHLRYLGIRGFGIESLPTIRRLIHLKYLWIRDCNIKELSSSIRRLIHLEYLSIKNSNIKELPSSIGRLIHLKYLSIRDSNIKELPSSIGKLVFLQTLDLRPDAFSKIRIPNVLWRLEQLRHLYLPSFMELPSTDKLRLDSLTKLQTLTGFTAEYCDVRCFPELMNLQKVDVRVDNKDLAVILQSRSLSYSNPPLQSSFYIVGDFQTEAEQRLLRQLLGCHYLHELDLCNTKLEEDPMPTLEELPNLTKLGLRWDSYIGKEMVCSSAPTTTTTSTAAASSSSGGRGYGCNGGFPQLKFLRLLGIRNLEEWRVEEGAMSTLFHLEIYFCPKLKEIPDGLRFITTLRELKIRGVSQVLKNRVREGGEDFYKVRHVPFITIFDY